MTDSAAATPAARTPTLRLPSSLVTRLQHHALAVNATVEDVAASFLRDALDATIDDGSDTVRATAKPHRLIVQSGHGVSHIYTDYVGVESQLRDAIDPYSSKRKDLPGASMKITGAVPV